jgi:hypothetical protein
VKWAEEAFDFLLSDYDFSCTTKKYFEMIYENDKIEIRVSHPRSEFGLAFRQKNMELETPGNPIYIEDILNYKRVLEKEKYYGLAAMESESIRFCVNKLAELMAKYTVEFLEGDPAAYQCVKDFAVEKQKIYRNKNELSLIRKKVATAWEEKNYARIVELFGPVRERITNAEKKKLDYCKKKM